MMRRVFTFLVGMALCAGASTPANAQTFEETLKNLSLDAAKAYVNPIVSGFGVDLNGGWFHRAPSKTMLGFDLEFGVVAMETFFKEDAKKFNSNGTFSLSDAQAASLTLFVNSDPQFALLTPTQRDNIKLSLQNQITAQFFTLGISGPTIVGSSLDSIAIAFASKTFAVAGAPGGSVTVPGQRIVLPVTGYLGELKALPLAAPQLTLGTFVGSQFTFRYLPSTNTQNLGKASYFGWGIQHNPAIWLGPVDVLPVDFSLSFFTQKLKVGTTFETKATAFGVNVSKRLGWGFLNLTPYAGFMFEKSTMSFAYDFNAPDPTNNGAITTQHVTFDLDSANKSRLVLGLSFKILIVNINADYNIGKYNSATAGIMFII
jgi:hypothetical protein